MNFKEIPGFGAIVGMMNGKKKTTTADVFGKTDEELDQLINEIFSEMVKHSHKTATMGIYFKELDQETRYKIYCWACALNLKNDFVKYIDEKRG